MQQETSLFCFTWVSIVVWGGVTPTNVGCWLVNGPSIMLNFSKIIPDPMFEKWFLNNANFFGGPKFFILGTYSIRVWIPSEANDYDSLADNPRSLWGRVSIRAIHREMVSIKCLPRHKITIECQARHVYKMPGSTSRHGWHRLQKTVRRSSIKCQPRLLKQKDTWHYKMHMSGRVYDLS